MKKLSVLLFILLIPSLVFAQNAGQTLSNAELQKIIQDLVKQVQTLRQQVEVLQRELGATAQAPSTTPAPEVQAVTMEALPPELTRSLSRGSSGDDVRKLQEFLAKDKNIYPEGLVTGYFGPLTEAAVKKWQEKHDIESVGVIGPKTIAKFQELGRGVIQGLIDQGAGASGVIPPGLLTAPGIQNKLGSATTTTGQTTSTVGTVTSTLGGVTTTFTGTTSTASTTSTTQSPLVSGTPGTPTTSGTSNSTQSTTSSTTTATSTATNATSATSDTTPPSATSTTSDTTPPSEPTSLSASAVSTSQINLSWFASIDSVAVVGYKIYRNGTFLMDITTSTANPPPTYYSDSGLSPSTAYTYTVAAYDAAGNASAQSSQASATTQANQITATAFPTCGQVVKNVPGDYSGIQAAIDVSVPGDTVRVAAGTYNEQVRINQYHGGICLEGAGIDQTIITKSGDVGIYLEQASYIIVKNLTVRGSGVGGCCSMGGGIFTYSANNILIQSCRLTQNNAHTGGGLYANHTTNLTVDHCLIDNNHATHMVGGVYVEPASTGIFTNVTIVNNTADHLIGGFGYAINQGISNRSLAINNSIFWGNNGALTYTNPPPGHGTYTGAGSTNYAIYGTNTNPVATVNSSDIGGWSGGTNNINADPQFVSTIDYHLQSSSPAVNMGVYPSAGTQSFLKNAAPSLASILESLKSLTSVLQKIQELLR